jgi:hypothetical protein
MYLKSNYIYFLIKEKIILNASNVKIPDLQILSQCLVVNN